MKGFQFTTAAKIKQPKTNNSSHMWKVEMKKFRCTAASWNSCIRLLHAIPVCAFMFFYRHPIESAAWAGPWAHRASVASCLLVKQCLKIQLPNHQFFMSNHIILHIGSYLKPWNWIPRRQHIWSLDCWLPSMLSSPIPATMTKQKQRKLNMKQYRNALTDKIIIV